MKKEISTGGSVYPIQGYSGMKLIDYFAAHAPTPSGEDIKRQVLKDISANAHNDNNKPPLRSELEIICDLKYKYAAKMVLAREKCLGNM